MTNRPAPLRLRLARSAACSRQRVDARTTRTCQATAWMRRPGRRGVGQGAAMGEMKDRMPRGELYIADDPDLATDLARAQELLDRFNRTLHAEQDTRHAILRELIGDLGEGVEIRPAVPLRVRHEGVDRLAYVHQFRLPHARRGADHDRVGVPARNTRPASDGDASDRSGATADRLGVRRADRDRRQRLARRRRHRLPRRDDRRRHRRERGRLSLAICRPASPRQVCRPG